MDKQTEGKILERYHNLLNEVEIALEDGDPAWMHGVDCSLNTLTDVMDILGIKY